MKNYYRIILGRKHVHAQEAFEGGFIGAGWFENLDLTQESLNDQSAFTKQMISLYLKQHPDKSKISAGLACGFLWTIVKGIQIGDIVLCPDGQGQYRVGEIISDYQYVKDGVLPHRRKVMWSTHVILRSEMSEALRNSVGSIGTVSLITNYVDELESLLRGSSDSASSARVDEVEDLAVFALEKHLEDFLVTNWKYTELGKKYDVYEEDGEIVGRQYPSDTGPMDILAISKDKKELLVVELKKVRTSDAVVGQVQRYMGYVKAELAEPYQSVRGVIIAPEEDVRIYRALSVAQNIEFYTYKIQFQLEKKQGYSCSS